MKNCNNMIQNRCIRVICPKCRKAKDIMFKSEELTHAQLGRTFELRCACGRVSKVKSTKVV